VSERESLVTRLVREETSGLHPRLLLLQLLGAMLPNRNRARRNASLLRMIGFVVGQRSEIHGLPRITGSKPQAHGDDNGGLYANLTIGSNVVIARDVVLDLEQCITIADNAVLGAQVMILTSTHELGPRERRAGPVTRSPVTIGIGAWIGARSVILPGVTIGDGAIVAPGSVVNKDVLPNLRVAGAPAKKVEVLDDGRTAADTAVA
jgi:maltose O-acetyltransferase